jgi:hypothetical protein
MTRRFITSSGVGGGGTAEAIPAGWALPTSAALLGFAGATAKRWTVGAAYGALFRLGGDIDSAACVVLPQGAAAVAEAQQARVEAGEVLGDVLQVALQDGGGVVVEAGVDDLGQVDEGRAVAGNEDVVGGEVAVDAARAQQQPHLSVDFPVQQGRDVGGQLEVGEAGCRGAVVVDEELHEQDVFVQKDRLGDADAGVEGVGEGLVLHVAPRTLDELAAVGRALAHGALVAAVACLVTTLDVVGGGLEGAVLAVLVDLGGDELATSLDDPDRGFLAGHEAGTDVVDDAVFEELGEAVGQVHGTIVSERGVAVYVDARLLV